MNNDKRAIICIDDDQTILKSLKSQLQRNFGTEYVYELAEDAEEGFEVIEELMKNDVQILIIVSDWLMPGMKGDEFLTKVHEKYPRIVKVLLTGQADELAIENSYTNANLYKHIFKPWTEHELVETVKNGLLKI